MNRIIDVQCAQNHVWPVVVPTSFVKLSDFHCPKCQQEAVALQLNFSKDKTLLQTAIHHTREVRERGRVLA